MKNQLFSHLDADRLRMAINLFVTAVLLIGFALLIGITDNLLTILMLCTGVVMVFYALLYPWGKASYYAILGGIFLVLFILFLFVGLDRLVKMEAAGKLHVHGAEDIGMSVGMVFAAGILAGLIGLISRVWVYYRDRE